MKALHWAGSTYKRPFSSALSPQSPFLPVQPFLRAIRRSSVHSQSASIRLNCSQRTFPKFLHPRVKAQIPSHTQRDISNATTTRPATAQDEAAEHNFLPVGNIHPRCSTICHSLAYLERGGGDFQGPRPHYRYSVILRSHSTSQRALGCIFRTYTLSLCTTGLPWLAAVFPT